MHQRLRGFVLLCTLVMFARAGSAQNFNLQFRSQLTYNTSLSNIWGYVDTVGNEYALVGTGTGLSIVDVTNPNNPIQRFNIPFTNSEWREVKTYHKHAYVTNESGGGLLIVDLSQLPDTVTFHAFTGNGITTAHTDWVDENGYLYLFGYNTTSNLPVNQRGALVFDLNPDPDNPTYAGAFNGAYLHDGFVRGDTLWGSEVYNGQLAVMNVTDKNNFQLMALHTTPLAFCHNAWPTSDNHYVFTTDEKPNSSLTSYDVSNLNNITELDEAQSNPGSNVIIHNVHLVNNDFAAVSYYRDGAVIFDVSQPDNIIEVGSYDTSPSLSGDGFNGDWGVYPYLPSGNWVASDIENGLFVLTPTYVKAARLQGLVTDTVTGYVLSGVQVKILTTQNSDVTKLNGMYKTGNASGGNYQVQFLKAGYATKIINVQLFNDSIVTRDVALVPLQGFTVMLQVVDSATMQPLTNAKVFMTDYGLYQFNASTNSTGYSNLNPVYTSDYDAIVGAWGYQTKLINIGTLTGGDTISIPLRKRYYDDFFFDFGWTNTHTATTGFWQRIAPVGSDYNNTPVDPSVDMTGDFGNTCYVTGNSGGTAGNDDVDNGDVTLMSPVFNLTDAVHPYVHYSRWFADTGGSGTAPNDSMVVKIGNGVATQTLETVTYQTNANELSQWINKSFRIENYLATTANMQLSFRVVDTPPGHLVVGAVDLFYVTDSTNANVPNIVTNGAWLLYPNPSTNQLNLVNASTDVGSYQIMSATGAVMNEGQINARNTTINSSKLASGIYIINVQTNHDRATLRFVKQ